MQPDVLIVIVVVVFVIVIVVAVESNLFAFTVIADEILFRCTG